MRRHNWKFDDFGIDICSKCGMYRCEQWGDSIPEAGRPRSRNIEYSLPNGEVIAVNPDRVPACTGENK